MTGSWSPTGKGIAWSSRPMRSAASTGSRCRNCKEPPATLAKSNLSYTQGLLPWQGRTVGLLDADRLFSSLNRSLT